MTTAEIMLALQYVVLVYFAVLNVLYSLFGYLGLRAILLYNRQVSRSALKDLLERDFYKPISILVPAHNEEGSIVASVRNLLSLQHPEYEVVVINDGSQDGTLARLADAFDLQETELIVRRTLRTKPERGIYRTVLHPNLIVVDKDNGGKADALNMGINLAQFPIVCAIDADSLLDADALLRASRLFAEDDDVVAVGGTVRPLNGGTVSGGHVTELHAPKRWIERFQVLEYGRAFFTGRAGWSALGALLIISGAFGLFRRTSVIAAGGYDTETVGEDMELVVRLQKQARERGGTARVVATPDPICWTEVPRDFRSLRRQRNRWQRGLWETLGTHRDMLFNRRFGRLGMIGIPYFWLFEGASPIMELLGFGVLIAAAATGTLDLGLAALFLLLAVAYGALLSQLAVGIETLLLSRYTSLRDRMKLLAAALLEFIGYHQLLSLERLIATFQVRRKRGRWGKAERAGITSS